MIIGVLVENEDDEVDDSARAAVGRRKRSDDSRCCLLAASLKDGIIIIIFTFFSNLLATSYWEHVSVSVATNLVETALPSCVKKFFEICEQRVSEQKANRG